MQYWMIAVPAALTGLMICGERLVCTVQEEVICSAGDEEET